jgi:outer membrane protein TolC
MDLTGCSEPGARSVFMFACPRREQDESADKPDSVVLQTGPESEFAESFQSVHSLRNTAALFLFLCAFGFAQAAEPSTNAMPALETTPSKAAETSATNSILDHPLSLADCVNIALRQNPNILRAQKDLEAAQGVAIQTRAVAVPKLVATGAYNANQLSDVDIVTVPNPPGPPSTFGNDQTWSSQVKLVQSIYEGGRLMSSVRSARLTKQQSMLNYRTAVADAVLSVQLAYYDVLLAIQQILVEEASVDLLTRELTDTTRRFEAGTVPRFNVLRAEVELANERPRLIQARNSYRIGKCNLVTLLGFSAPKDTHEDIPLTLSGKLEAVPFQLDLPQALESAFERRTELGSLRKAEALRKEDLVSAKAGYKPGVQIFGGYDGHNSLLSLDLGVVKYGWIAGAQVTWNIFDGYSTRGRVQQAAALHDKAVVDLDDSERRIELEVRTAYSNFIEADEVLKSQEKVVEEAEEALRLASARSDAGTGTQLDVLSAQTALTQARSTRVQALHDFAAARARLERAVGMNLE